MIHFNVCRSEEVISFFWRSVYILLFIFLLFYSLEIQLTLPLFALK